MQQPSKAEYPRPSRDAVYDATELTVLTISTIQHMFVVPLTMALKLEVTPASTSVTDVNRTMDL